MPVKKLFAALTILGIILPYSQFVPWVMDNGLDLKSFIHAIMDSRIGLFAWLDVLISAVALLVIIVQFRQALTIRQYIVSIIGTLLIGVSFGLPYLAFCLSDKGFVNLAPKDNL